MKKRGRRGLRAHWLVIPALFVVLAIVLVRVVVIRQIDVVGNRNVPRQEIVEASGIRVGQSPLTINTADLRRRLEENRYIEYLGRDYDYKGTLTLRVRERIGMGTVNILGLYYVLDETGVVLECTGLTRSETASGPVIAGLTVNENLRVTVGETLPVRDSLQLSQMRRVLSALSEVNMLARVTELDIEQSDNLHFMTREGARVILGDDRDLVVKLLIAREVLSIRKDEGGLFGARIDVSSGRDAHFIPDALPTITPTPTATPTVAPDPTPRRR